MTGKMTTPRDTQRSKVYAAETRAFRGATQPDDVSIERMQALLDKWQASKVLARHYPRAAIPVEVRDGRGRRRACYDANCWPVASGFLLAPRPAILLPKWARTKWVLAHEFAHHLTHDEGAWHGHEFCKCYLYLVRVFIGPWAEEALEREFKAGKVRYRPPRKVTITDGERERRREQARRMQAARREVAA